MQDAGARRDARFEGLRTPAAVGLAAVATLGLALLLAAAAGLPPTIAVTGVANVFLAARTMAAFRPAQRFAELPVVALLVVVASAFGQVLVAAPPVGAALLALAVAASVWARRFGPRGRRIGRLAAAPFVSVLIVPVPALAAGPGAVLLVPVVAILGQVLAAASLTLLRVRAAEAPAAPPASARPSDRRIGPSTRQALQILVALLVAFAVGFLVFGPHWAWVVITVYVVQIGARGRGDAVLKAVERLGGAVGGTVVGMLVALIPLPDPVRIVLILVVLVAAVALRARTYVWWAAGITTALALLYDVLGISAPTDLLPRIGAVVVGGIVAGLASWFVLPIRSRDVLRRRLADELAAVQEVLHALREGEEPTLAAVRSAADRVAEVGATHRAQHVVLRRLRRPPSPEDLVVVALARVELELDGLAAAPPGRTIGLLERQVGALRRLNGRQEVERPPLPPEGPLRPMAEAIDALWDPVARLR